MQINQKKKKILKQIRVEHENRKFYKSLIKKIVIEIRSHVANEKKTNKSISNCIS